MMIVLDASAAVGMVSRTPEGLALAQLLLSGEKVISHDLLSVEVCEAFREYQRMGETTRADALEYVAKAMSLVDELIDVQALMREALVEAIRLDRSVSDMLYFVLARREGATLFTLDKELQSVCLSNGVNCVYLDTEF